MTTPDKAAATGRTGGRWVFRPWITTRSGKRIYAHWYGKRAFRIWVEDE